MASMQAENPRGGQQCGKFLDLAFAMDCTSSMGTYINSARSHICAIVHEIIATENTDVRFALVEYRDHPPEDNTFVTRTHDFTANPKFMQRWLDECSAKGGGDIPEALADALKDVSDLTWRDDATKICVCISDAPPHGLGCDWDGIPDGCPLGIDPVAVTHQLASKGVTLYVVGCEPTVRQYRDFFMALSFITGGQYVPISQAQLLTKVITAGAQEEISLEQYMSEVDEEVNAEVSAGREIDENEFVLRVHMKLQSKGAQTKQLQRNNASLEEINASDIAKKMSNMQCLSDVRQVQVSVTPSNYDLISFDVCSTPPSPMHSGTTSLGAYRMAGPGIPTSLATDYQAVPMMHTPGISGTSARPFEDYRTIEGGISYGQSARMVQKSIARNFAKKKGT